MGLHPVMAFNEGVDSTRFFEILGLPYLTAVIQGFKAKFGSGDLHRMKQAENNYWDYGIERKFGSG